MKKEDYLAEECKMLNQLREQIGKLLIMQLEYVTELEDDDEEEINAILYRTGQYSILSAALQQLNQFHEARHLEQQGGMNQIADVLKRIKTHIDAGMN